MTATAATTVTVILAPIKSRMQTVWYQRTSEFNIADSLNVSRTTPKVDKF